MTTTPRKPRQRNPRRVVSEMLAEIRGIATHMVYRWKFVPGTDLYRNADGRLGYHGHRERKDIPAAEYIENDPAYWAELYNQMDQLVRQAAEVRRFARDQYVATGGKLGG